LQPSGIRGRGRVQTGPQSTVAAREAPLPCAVGDGGDDVNGCEVGADVGHPGVAGVGVARCLQRARAPVPRLHRTRSGVGHRNVQDPRRARRRPVGRQRFADVHHRRAQLPVRVSVVAACDTAAGTLDVFRNIIAQYVPGLGKPATHRPIRRSDPSRRPVDDGQRRQASNWPARVNGASVVELRFVWRKGQTFEPAGRSIPATAHSERVLAGPASAACASRRISSRATTPHVARPSTATPSPKPHTAGHPPAW